MSVRLNKLLAERGIGARRKCDELIQSGAVRINGGVVTEPGTQVEPGRDRVEVNGRPLPPPQRHVYYVLHKPVGVISTLHDPEGRATVRELLPPGARLFPVGRLDADTSGVLLLTNDGELAHHLMHPRYGVSKSYRVHADRVPGPAMLKRLQDGIEFEPGVVSAPALVRVLDHTPGDSVLEISIHEGRYRQVRRMCEAAGLNVHRLHRWAYGPLKLKDLPRGMWRELSEAEVAALRAGSARPMRGGAVPHRPRGLRRGRAAGAPADPRERAPREYRGAAPDERRSGVRERSPYRDRGAERPPRGRPRFGDRPRRPGGPGDRPERAREERGGRPLRPRGEERGRGERERGDRPARSRERGTYPPRERGDRPFRSGERGERPFRPREDRGGRPFRAGERGERPFRPREDRGDRPFRSGERGERPFRPREDRGDRPFRSGERGERPFRPRADRGGAGSPRSRRPGEERRPRGRFGREPGAGRLDRGTPRGPRADRGGFRPERPARPPRGFGKARGPAAGRPPRSSQGFTGRPARGETTRRSGRSGSPGRRGPGRRPRREG